MNFIKNPLDYGEYKQHIWRLAGCCYLESSAYLHTVKSWKVKKKNR